MMTQTEAVDRNRVATYIRWSTDDQTDGTTLEVQMEACRFFIQSQGWTFRDDMVFVDDGYSGATLERPGLTRLRAAVSAGMISCVVVYKLDRLSRSVLDTVNLVLKEWEGVCSVRSTREPVDTTNPAGSILFYMLASYAEWERSTIRERTHSGRVKRAQQGKNPGFPPPYGYAKGPEAGTFVVYEPEAVVVRRIYREYLSGKGIHKIALGLTQDGIKPRRSEIWNPNTIDNVVTNPVYTGVLRYGLSQATTPAQRKQLKKLRVFFDEPRHACVVGAVDPIISPEDFERAQRVRASKSFVKGSRARGANFLLSGIAQCKCGGAIRGDERREGNRYYRCSQIQTSNPNRCDGGLIPADSLDPLVLEHVRNALAPDRRAALMSTWEKENATRLNAVQAEMGQVSAAQAKVEKTRARITADYKSGDLPAKLYAAHCEDLDKDEVRLRGSLAALEAEMRRLKDAQCDLSDFDHVAHQLDSWKNLDPEEQKQVLRFAVARLVVYRPAGVPGARAHMGQIHVELEIRQIGS